MRKTVASVLVLCLLLTPTLAAASTGNKVVNWCSTTLTGWFSCGIAAAVIAHEVIPIYERAKAAVKEKVAEVVQQVKDNFYLAYNDGRGNCTYAYRGKNATAPGC